MFVLLTPADLTDPLASMPSGAAQDARKAQRPRGQAAINAALKAQLSEGPADSGESTACLHVTHIEASEEVGGSVRTRSEAQKSAMVMKNAGPHLDRHCCTPRRSAAASRTPRQAKSPPP